MQPGSGGGAGAGGSAGAGDDALAGGGDALSGVGAGAGGNALAVGGDGGVFFTLAAAAEAAEAKSLMSMLAVASAEHKSASTSLSRAAMTLKGAAEVTVVVEVVREVSFIVTVAVVSAAAVAMELVRTMLNGELMTSRVVIVELRRMAMFV